MEYTSLIDTSLDLSIKPLQLLDDGVKQEVQSNLPELGTKVPVKEEADALVDELNRVSAENKKLTEMLTVLCENYTALRSQLMDYMSKNPGIDNNTGSKKRKAESTTTNNNNNTIIDATNEPSESRESSSSDEGSCKKPREEHFKAKTSKVYYRTEPSDTGLIVKDGYQWRKYGQKVTRDNPSPRAYFKCSFAPSCPVKKKVQRSVEDQSILVATYEGEHNHPHPSKMETPASNSSRSVTLGSVPCSTTLSSSGVPTVALDLTNPKSHEEVRNSSSHRVDSPELQQFFIQHMASSLTKDPTFKAALAAAISGKFLQHNQTEKW